MDLASNSGSQQVHGSHPVPRVVVALIRHGKYAQPDNVMSAHLPYPLTAKGEQQASSVVGSIVEAATEEGLNIHPVVDSSILLRAWQTADILSRGLGTHTGSSFSVEEFADLTERSVGSATNLTIEQIEQVVACDPRNPPLPEHWRSNSDICLPFPGAESLVDAGKRVAAHLRERAHSLRQEVQQDTLKLVVGHGGSFRHAALDMGLLTREEVGNLSMDYCRPVFMELNADGTWVHLSGSWKERRRHHAVD